MESTTGNTPQRKKNAASQFRSRRKRISHPLLGDDRGDASTSITPPRKQKQATTTTAESERAWGEWENVTPATPEHSNLNKNATLLTALEMAARSPKRTNNECETKKGDATAAATASYNSSIEAMAAHVEASHTSKKTRTNKKQQPPTTNSHKIRLPPIIKKKISSGSVSSTRSSTSSKSRKSSSKSSSKSAHRSRHGRTTTYFPTPKNRVWRIAIPVLLAFIVCEFCLLVLVFRSEDMATDETVGSLAPEVPAVGSDNLTPISEEVIADEKGMGEQVVVDETGFDDELDDDTSHGFSDTSDQQVGSDVTESTEELVTDEDTESMEESGMDITEPTEVPIVVDATESAEELPSDATTEPSSEAGIGTEDPPDQPVLDVEGTPEEPDSDLDAKEPLLETGMDVEDTPNELELDVEEPLEEPLNAPDMDAEEPIDEDTAVESKSGEIDRLQSMLEEGFARLRRSMEEPNEESNRKLTESLCGNVWVLANAKLSSESLHGDDSERDVEPVHNQIPNLTLEIMSRIESNPWKSLALESQHCLAGAGLAFLSEEIDSVRLRVSTKIFDRLSYVAPYDLNARAGLGTSLLLESIFQLDDDSGSNAEETEGAHRSLLMAKYHLKIASFLCSTSPRAMAGDDVYDGDDDVDVDDDYGEINMAAIPDTLLNVNDEYMATNAAILHNLALVHIALGDKENSIPILLQAAALRREFSIETTKLYWNAPHEVLQMAEEKALLIAANTVKLEKKTKRRIPFLRADLEIKGVAV